MEQTKVLVERVNDYKKECENALNAKSVQELDTAKVAGLKAFRQVELQLNRARKDLLNICNSRRYELVISAREEVLASVQPESVKQPDNSITRFEKLVSDLNSDATKITSKATSKKPTKRSKK